MSEILIGSNPDNPEVVGAVNFEATAEEKAKTATQALGVSHFVCYPPSGKRV
jgi:hypothetical protein